MRVLSAEADRVILEAPLEPNLNHQESAFGGSVAALAILTGWTAVHLRLRREGLETNTVIQDASIRYDEPIRAPFRGVARPIDEGAWRRLVRALTRKGRGRVHVDVTLESEGMPSATFRGAYVALARG